MSARLLHLALAGILLALVSGCSTYDQSGQSGPRAESSIPWNRPAKWEGPGALGGSMPTMQ